MCRAPEAQQPAACAGRGSQRHGLSSHWCRTLFWPLSSSRTHDTAAAAAGLSARRRRRRSTSATARQQQAAPAPRATHSPSRRTPPLSVTDPRAKRASRSPPAVVGRPGGLAGPPSRAAAPSRCNVFAQIIFLMPTNDAWLNGMYPPPERLVNQTGVGAPAGGYLGAAALSLELGLHSECWPARRGRGGSPCGARASSIAASVTF